MMLTSGRMTFLMPLPPPPKAALKITGKPYLSANTLASLKSLIGSGVPGTHLTPMRIQNAMQMRNGKQRIWEMGEAVREDSTKVSSPPTCLCSSQSGQHLVTHASDDFWGGSNHVDASIFTGLRKIAPFWQKAIARVNCIHVVILEEMELNDR